MLSGHSIWAYLLLLETLCLTLFPQPLDKQDAQCAACLPHAVSKQTNKQTNFNFLLVFDFQWSSNIQFYIVPTCIKSASKNICHATVQIKPFEKVMSQLCQTVRNIILLNSFTAGCKESQFYSLPFRLAVARHVHVLAQTSL